MISRDILYHLDFDITVDIPNKQYILTNKIEEDKHIIVNKIALVRKNKYLDFIFPASLTISVNDNYTVNIIGLTSKQTPMHNLIINCNDRWKFLFDGYDSNTVIYLIGKVLEPEGRHINI